MKFVDSHIHFYDLAHRDLKYAWLEPDFVHPVIGDINPIKALRYTGKAYEAETRFCGVRKAVHVQAALGSDDPVAETAWVVEQAEESGLELAIVGDARMQAPDVERTIERHAQFPMMRGLRDFAQGDYLVDPDFDRGYAVLNKYNLSYDLDATWEDLDKARALAERHPDTLLILGHAGFPRARSDEYYNNWRAAMTRFAGAPNVAVKISGLGMVDQRWTVESIRPWVLSCLEAFGIERCMFGTNWPVDRLFSSYTDLVAAYRAVVADLSDAEQDLLFARNAEKFYRF